jgi:glucose/arabinose dehydrogenase
VDNSTSGAAYTGLAQAFNGSGAFLYAVNFHQGTVDVFDSTFRPVRKVGAFQDPQLPGGYVPFGISAINSRLYVTYALQAADKRGEVRAPGNGFIDIFDTEGNLVKRFASQGQLNAPWGMAWAPFEGFAKFNNALFVGNFGDGSINAFDFDSGDFLGTVNDANGRPINNPGIWALQFGLGVAGSTSDTLLFTAGIAAEKHGLLGALKVNSSSPTPEQVPAMVDPSLNVTTVVSKLDQPTGMVFLGDGDFLVIEKATGKVQHVVKGSVVGTALDLAVNSASERGLLGIALQPDFEQSHGVYLYWTQSSTGADSANLAEVPLLGNRVDRYIWDSSAQTLTFDKNIIMLHAFQADAGQPMRGNHDGGKTVFGPDGKLYIQIGDQGRRGQLQNLASGPFGPGQPDDQFGGPAPDNAHLTGVILRLNADGTIPTDNPFAKVTIQDMAAIEQRAGVPLAVFAQLDEIVTNVHKIFSYGRRNGFGLAFDPATGFLWESENGDDSFDEMNHITAGCNGGWIQIMGPARRVAEFKDIEASFTPLQGNLPVAGNLPFTAIDPANLVPALQQVRWPPSLIADSRGEARSRLFVLPGSHYEDPEFSWKWAVAPAGIGFAGTGLGSHAGSLFVGASRTFLDEGYLFEFKFDEKREHFAFSDPKLKGRVDNNHYKFDEGQSTSLVAGKNFGIVTDIVTGPDGALYVTSLSNGAVYAIR